MHLLSSPLLDIPLFRSFVWDFTRDWLCFRCLYGYLELKSRIIVSECDEDHVANDASRSEHGQSGKKLFNLIGIPTLDHLGS